jgi:hypothetical protein
MRTCVATASTEPPSEQDGTEHRGSPHGVEDGARQQDDTEGDDDALGVADADRPFDDGPRRRTSRGSIDTTLRQSPVSGSGFLLERGHSSRGAENPARRRRMGSPPR